MCDVVAYPQSAHSPCRTRLPRFSSRLGNRTHRGDAETLYQTSWLTEEMEMGRGWSAKSGWAKVDGGRKDKGRRVRTDVDRDTSGGVGLGVLCQVAAGGWGVYGRCGECETQICTHARRAMWGAWPCGGWWVTDDVQNKHVFNRRATRRDWLLGRQTCAIFKPVPRSVSIRFPLLTHLGWNQTKRLANLVLHFLN